MANNTHSILLVLVLLLHHFSELSHGASSLETLHRKLIVERDEKMKKGDGEMQQQEWELRRVPAGPDPLHHNSQDPNTPRTTP